VRLIAEPWDVGPGGYQVGSFPPGWAEWTDRFRDDVRDAWRGEGPITALAPRLLASPDNFNHHGRRAYACVNFVTAHDGFTLNDVVTYNDKHNEANGEDNRDGSSNNRSWNCGVEGPTDDEAINDLRSRQIRNMMATLLLSQGTPMLVAGDEFGRTQRGNNNAYCQDSEISWLDWDLREKGEGLLEFTKKLAGLRHKYPILRHSRFLTGEINEETGVKAITWVDAGGAEFSREEWEDKSVRCFGMLMDGRAQSTGLVKRGSDATMLLILNSWHEGVSFKLPEAPDGIEWRLLIDTDVPDLGKKETFDFGDAYEVASRSLLLFVMER
jgi:glycogen operon protein